MAPVGIRTTPAKRVLLRVNRVPRTLNDRWPIGGQLTLLGVRDESIVPHHEIARNERISEL